MIEKKTINSNLLTNCFAIKSNILTLALVIFAQCGIARIAQSCRDKKKLIISKNSTPEDAFFKLITHFLA